MLASYTYGATTERLISEEGDVRTYYLWSGSRVITEYTEVGSSTEPVWTKQYVYLGARLLAVMQPSGGGSERVEFHHPDRLGTRLVTSSQDGSYYEQVTLPFGVALEAESSGATNRRFTSYDRSSVTGLDYAVNRHYDPQQGRFTQVDPIGMKSVDLTDPQTLNLYAYVKNDPVNFTDPSGLMMEGGVSCYIDGVESDCGLALRMVEAGAAVIGPASTLEYNHELGIWMRFTATANGSGWIPVGARHLGGLSWGWTDYAREDAPSYTFTLSREWPGGLVQVGGSQARPFTTSLPEVSGQVILVAPVRSGPPLEDVRPSWENFQRALHRMFGSWEGFINSLFPPPGVLAGDVTLVGGIIKKWLGPGARMIVNKHGDKILISSDGLRRVRFDFKYPHPHQNPHMHVEEFINGRWRKSGPIYPKDIPHR